MVVPMTIGTDTEIEHIVTPIRINGILNKTKNINATISQILINMIYSPIRING
jgi:hypothetical protein